jgi:uroporphyrinogen-III synthase
MTDNPPDPSAGVAPQVLITRPEPGASAFAQALRHAEPGPLEIILSPLMTIALQGALPDLGAFAGLIFSSANGVRAYAQAGGPAGLPAFAVGDATAHAAAEAGLVAEPCGGSADALVARLLTRHPATPLLHIRGSHSRGAVAARLTAAGIHTTDIVLYDQPTCPPTQAARAALQGARPLVAPLFSPRSAALLADMHPKAPLYVVALSDAVARAVTMPAAAMAVAATSDLKAMLAATGPMIAHIRELEADRAMCKRG